MTISVLELDLGTIRFHHAGHGGQWTGSCALEIVLGFEFCSSDFGRKTLACCPSTGKRSRV